MTMIFPPQNYKSAKSGKYNQNCNIARHLEQINEPKVSAIKFCIKLNDAIKT